MAKNFVGGVMIIYKLARTAADPAPPIAYNFCVMCAIELDIIHIIRINFVDYQRFM